MGRTLEIDTARAVLIAGPTASGKSALARRLAGEIEATGRSAIIVNADSMQVYDALRVLTARPSTTDEALRPHRLYGHVAAGIRYSVGAWLRDVKAVLGEANASGSLPILVGGTGLYFRALTEGLAAVPEVPLDLRIHWVERLKLEGPAPLHALLAQRDPLAAEKVRPTDPQRIARSLMVFDATGRSLVDWQMARAEPPLVDVRHTVRILVEIERRLLYRRIGERCDGMVAEGAAAEVEDFLRRSLDPTLPVMKAIGVRELGAFLRGELPLDDALERMKIETRRLSKRQATWFRHQSRDWRRLAI